MTTNKAERLPRPPRLMIEITEEDVKSAVKSDSGKCMIAEAIKRQLPEDDRRSVTVDLQTIRFSDSEKGVRYWYLTPPVAQDGLIRFDQGDPVEPIAFRLRGGNVSRMRSPSRQYIERRADRKAELQEKKAKGTPLSSGEKRALSLMDRTDKRRKKPLPATDGPRQIRQAEGRDTPSVVGGRAPSTTALTNARGRFRKFGLRTLKPPRSASGEGVGLTYVPPGES